MAGTRRIVFQLVAQASHVKAEIVGALLEPWSPDSGQDLYRPDELARAAQQDLQDPPFGRREPERPARAIGSRAIGSRLVGSWVVGSWVIGSRAPDLVRGEVD